MTRSMRLFGAVLAVGAILGLAGCKGSGEGYKKSQKRTQSLEEDCRKHGERLCEVPQKDGKVVLYCYKGLWPKVVKTRWEC